MPDEEAEETWESLVQEKGFFIRASNLFFSTSFAICIMELKKNKADSRIRFIHTTEQCVKVPSNNRLPSGEHPGYYG